METLASKEIFEAIGTFARAKGFKKDEAAVKECLYLLMKDKIGAIRMPNGTYLPWHEIEGEKYLSISMRNHDPGYSMEEIAKGMIEAYSMHQWNTKTMPLEALKGLLIPTLSPQVA